LAKQEITAIIYDRKGNILSIGKNSYVKTHPLQYRYAKRNNLEKKIYLHAEIDALAKCKDLNKAYRIVVMRFAKDGSPVNAKPCPICEDAIKSLTGIKIVEHT
jgi:deoxycytidylate deaminase